MTNYSIEKVGADYVVKVDDQSVMKMGSRRRAAQLVIDAQELLEEAPLTPAESLSDEREAGSVSCAHGDACSGSAESAV